MKSRVAHHSPMGKRTHTGKQHSRLRPGGEGKRHKYGTKRHYRASGRN